MLRDFWFIRASVPFSCVLFVACAWPRYSSAQDSTDRLCSSKWFASQREAATSKKRTFQLIGGGFFDEQGKSYALAISHATGSDKDLDFMVYTASTQSLEFRLLYTERIDIFDAEQLSLQESQCLIEPSGPYFNVAVVDLSGDGTQQIVVESNSIGVCSSCLSQVSVYRVERDKISTVVSEYYNDIKYGKGQGLWVHSFRRTSGQIVPIEKSFFGAKSPQKKAR